MKWSVFDEELSKEEIMIESLISEAHYTQAMSYEI